METFTEGVPHADGQLSFNNTLFYELDSPDQTLSDSSSCSLSLSPPQPAS